MSRGREPAYSSRVQNAVRSRVKPASVYPDLGEDGRGRRKLDMGNLDYGAGVCAAVEHRQATSVECGEKRPTEPSCRQPFPGDSIGPPFGLNGVKKVGFRM